MTKIGIIGTGKMAKHHARLFNEGKDVELSACCDVDKEAAAEFGVEWRIKKVYTDYREMLEAEELDGVSIITPDSSHAEISIAALEAGIPVLCEKPMAATMEGADRMLEAARKAGLPNMINYSKRNFPGLQWARDFIEKGNIGRIVHVEASYLQSWLTTASGSNWQTTPAFLWRLSTKHGSMGTLGDLGCHIYDMAAFLCGDITKIFCKLENFDKGVPNNKIEEYEFDANDSFVSTVVFESGAIGSIHSTRWAPGYRNREFIRVYGELGTLEFDANLSREQYRLLETDETEWAVKDAEKTPTNIERFVEWIRTGKEDLSDFYNGWKVQKYLDASFLSNREGREITMDLG